MGIVLGVGSLYAQPDGLSVGSSLPSGTVQLQQLDGSSVSVRSLLGEGGTAFVFWSNQCPWTDRYEERIQRLAANVRNAGIQFVLVNANAGANTSAESLEQSRQHANRRGYEIPYVRDANARFARALGASRTPHVFLFDGQGTLVYKGAFDDSPSGSDRANNPYLRNALEALLDGERPDVADTEPFGCTLKYPK